MDPLQLGHLIEGVVERDPLTDRLGIHVVDAQGRAAVVTIEDLVAPYLGKDVRLTLASFENLTKLAKIVEEQGGGRVTGVQPEEIPVPFNVVRKRGPV